MQRVIRLDTPLHANLYPIRMTQIALPPATRALAIMGRCDANALGADLTEPERGAS